MRRLREQTAQAMVEFALITALIAPPLIWGIGHVATKLAERVRSERNMYAVLSALPAVEKHWAINGSYLGMTYASLSALDVRVEPIVVVYARTLPDRFCISNLPDSGPAWYRTEDTPVSQTPC